ncbi:MAG: TRAP transporter substrate-binding protein DctP [Calditrichia bacterium]|nr:TRAP transporter substrate-binding protein DctP [Calditrichia bacterium]
MKRLVILFIFLLGLCQVAFPQKYTIKFATLAPEGSTWIKVMQEFNEEVKQLTDGNVKFKIYPGGIQGDERDVLSKIKLGQLHSAGFTGLGMGEILPEVRILDSPFLFRNNNEVDYISTLLYDEFSLKFEEAGYVLLGWTEAGFVYVFGQKPILSQQDLKGPKIWLWEGDQLAEAYFRALGVSPIPLSITDVLTSLQTNLIEMVYSPPLACVTLQWHTRVKYMMDVPLADVAGAVLVSKKLFDKMPESYQTILREQGKKHMRRLVELSRQDNEKSIELMKKNGIEIVSIPPENLADFYNAGQQARRNLVGKLYSQELLDRVENLLIEFRENEE